MHSYIMGSKFYDRLVSCFGSEKVTIFSYSPIMHSMNVLYTISQVMMIALEYIFTIHVISLLWNHANFNTCNRQKFK